VPGCFSSNPAPPLGGQYSGHFVVIQELLFYHLENIEELDQAAKNNKMRIVE
jgi:hypothetical protein